MYVRMITYSFLPSVSVDQAKAIYNDSLRLLETLDGYKGLSLLINEEAHQAISLSYWRDQSSANDAGASVLPSLMERTRNLVNRPPEVTGFDLVRHEAVFDQDDLA